MKQTPFPKASVEGPGRSGGNADPALAVIAASYGVPEPACRALQAIAERLVGDPHAPTAVKDPRLVRERHLADSLAGLEVEAIRRAGTLADLGAGAGLPGLALAAALPGCAVREIESQRRKCDFIGSLADEAGLENVTVVCSRAEGWREGVGANDVVVARALAAQPVVLEYAAPLLAPGGVLVEWRGKRDRVEERRGAAAAAELGLEPVEVRRVEPFAGARDLHLHIFAKTRPTPSCFPRRAGAAARRPLGAGDAVPPRR